MRNRIDEEETVISYPPPPHRPPMGPSRPREEEEGISTQIGGAISGYFTQVSVPDQLVVGGDIKVTIGFYAINPGALYWKTFLIVDCPMLGLVKVLDAARETGQEGGRTKTYTLGKMPDSKITISFFLFAHAAPGYDWSWTEYNAWLYGYPVEVTYLASSYKVITPVAAPPQTEILEIDITPAEGGYVRTSPTSNEGVSTWYDGTTGRFNYGISVQVIAYPYAGYNFDHWSDEIEGGVSYANPAYAKPMTEHRAVKCHFREIEVPPEEILEIDITPSGSGFVTVSPQPIRQSGNLYYYTYGTQVMVTAYPYAGYVFDHWSDEIVGGVNYSNPAPVKSMTENRSVKAHFRSVEVPPECAVDADCPTGYVCRGGVCVPEEEVPPTPPEEVKFPWVPAVLIGSGAVLLVASVKPKKK